MKYYSNQRSLTVTGAYSAWVKREFLPTQSGSWAMPIWTHQQVIAKSAAFPGSNLVGSLSNASGETQVGADSTLLGAGTWLQMEKELADGGLTLVDVGLNLIDQVWTDKPEDIVSGQDCNQNRQFLKSFIYIEMDFFSSAANIGGASPRIRRKDLAR